MALLSMSVWKKVIAYIALTSLIGYTMGISVSALASGEIRDKFSWIKFEKNPIEFILSLVGTVAFTVVLFFIIYLIYHHERYIVYMATKIWREYKKMTGPRL
ncbi:hypothetical protein MesoLj113c_40800 [Mesorhizobium sp. 113-3-9]|nr:hypothetical protein MesoLj113c_40800 [Mesorhizobium sp. 113-3-9]